MSSRIAYARDLEPRQLGMGRHVVRPASVIDWTGTVAGASKP